MKDFMTLIRVLNSPFEAEGVHSHWARIRQRGRVTNLSLFIIHILVLLFK